MQASTDPDFDGLYEDLNGNGRKDFKNVWNNDGDTAHLFDPKRNPIDLLHRD
jgi:hypothetical protein